MNELLTDKELITEVLTTEKNLSSLYHCAVQESSTEALHCDLKNILNESITKSHETFVLMQQKGLYQIEQVQQPAIDKVKNKFAQAAGQ